MIREFCKFVAPTIASLWIYALYTMVDGMFVGRGVGETALASVNLSMPYVTLIYTLSILLATGASTVISVALGKKEDDRASALFSMNFAVIGCIAALVTILTLTFLDQIVVFLGATQDNIAYVKEYVGVIATFSVFFMLAYNMETFVKTDGAPAVAIIGSLACGLTNVLLDYVFVMVFHWGVWGAAIATGISQVVATFIFVIYFLRYGKVLKFKRFRLDLAIYRKIIPLGLASGITEMSGGVVIYLFNWTILKCIGESGLVSYTVISYINTLVLNTMSGVSQGIQPIISYHYGAGEKRAYHKLLVYALTLTGFITAVYCILLEGFPGIFVQIFLNYHDDVALFVATERALRLYAVSFLFMGFNVVASGYFTAVEWPAYSFVLSIGRGLIFVALFLQILVSVGGADGIWLSPVASEALCAVIALCFLMRKKASVRQTCLNSDSA